MISICSFKGPLKIDSEEAAINLTRLQSSLFTTALRGATPPAAVDVLMAGNAEAQWGTSENMWVSGSCRSKTGEQKVLDEQTRRSLSLGRSSEDKREHRDTLYNRKSRQGLVDPVLALGLPLTSCIMSLGFSLQNEGFELDQWFPTL